MASACTDLFLPHPLITESLQCASVAQFLHIEDGYSDPQSSPPCPGTPNCLSEWVLSWKHLLVLIHSAIFMSTHCGQHAISVPFSCDFNYCGINI